MPVRLHHIVIDAHDLPGLTRFWTRALGWKVLSEHENEIVIGTDDQEIDRLLALGARRVDIGQNRRQILSSA
jgi:catechol 2,3-dioxygenase-like lactoylglutathione lyase family enzyme